jgi:hypothetical protein
MLLGLPVSAVNDKRKLTIALGGKTQSNESRDSSEFLLLSRTSEASLTDKLLV